MLKQALGKVLIDRIVESEEPNFEALAFFPGTTADDWKPHQALLSPHPRDPAVRCLTLTMQSFLLRTSHHTILVDTCVGDHKKREGGMTPASWHMATGGVLPKKLAAAGVRPDDIDVVMCTHLHSDHVGWNTRLVNGRWVPTFPNARYLMSARELEFWQAAHRQTPIESFGDSVLPVVEAGQAVLVADDHAIDDEVRFEPTPGHTPHHVSVSVASGSSRAVITGDLMHSPVQCREPGWRTRFDRDPAQAIETRKAFLERHCEAGSLVCGTHFPSPSFGRLVARSQGFEFAPAEAAARR